jgi:hypothetical protein
MNSKSTTFKLAFAAFLTFSFASMTQNAQAQKRSGKGQAEYKGHSHVNAHQKTTARKRVKRIQVAHFHYKNAPKRGARVNKMNANALTINHGGVAYRYLTGIWYKPNGKAWTVSRPARGARVKVLHKNHRKFTKGNRAYFYYYGVFYTQTNEEYEVVEAPLGAEIDSLPEGYLTITVNGEEFYELDGVYYMPSMNENDEEILVVVPAPK